MTRVLVGTLAVLALFASYLMADITDVVPGPLTDRPRPTPVAASVAPGAVVPPVPSSGVAEAPVPSPARLQALLVPVLREPPMGAGASAVVVDQETGTTLMSLDGARGVTPASTAKVFTAAAVLSRLGPDAQLPTRVVTSAPGRITLVGGGDIFLGTGAPAAGVQGHASLASLAAQTAARLKGEGVSSVSLSLDDSLFPGVGAGRPLVPGWDPSDVTIGFVAPVSSFAVNAGRLKNERYARRQPDPAKSATDAFAAALRARGITVAPALTRTRAAATARTLGTVWSAPISDVVRHVMLESDNNGADVLARLVAIAQGTTAPTGTQGGSAVIAELSRLGVQTAGMRLTDGAGLSAGSLGRADALAATLAAAASGEYPDISSLLTALPVAGLTGTLSVRFDQPNTLRSRGLVRAKTGSLTGVSTLAGTVRDVDGRTLIFAVMAGTAADGVGARAVIDKAVTILANCGCR